jgi:hypothetical protein
LWHHKEERDQGGEGGVKEEGEEKEEQAVNVEVHMGKEE